MSAKGPDPELPEHGATFTIDGEYLKRVLLGLLEIPSPTGFTDNVVHFAARELARLGVETEVTRRGAIRGVLEGHKSEGKRALVAHLDTIGAMVTRRKENGRLAVAPIGNWSSRFAEGARCTVFTEEGGRRGTLLPLKASGHTYGPEIDEQPVAWSQIELRVDEHAASAEDLVALGFHVGDVVAIDPAPEITQSGYVVSRHLDDKGGVALLLAVVKALRDAGLKPAVDTYILLTISEEVGSGASAVLHGDVASMVAIEMATPAPDQNSTERGVTLAFMDSSGPFDYHLTHLLINIARKHGIVHTRDVFKHYRCDAASAVEAGNDIRTALACFGVDASHGYERTHMDSLLETARLLAHYALTPPQITRDRHVLAGLRGFPHLPDEEAEPAEVFTPPTPDADDSSDE